jgi:tetratricopeptide (TPR) repeat protein
MRRFRLLLAGAALAALAGCGGQPVRPAELPAKRLQAIEANNRASALFQRGDYAGAAGEFRRALEIERSTENEDGIAANLINLSIVYQRLGERNAARAAVAEVLNDTTLRFPQGRIAEAALRSAILLADERQLEAAAKALERARAACPGRCGLEGKIDNVAAQLALLRGEHEAARAAASRALGENRSRADREEIANSLRLLGAVALESGKPAEVEALAREALELDKQLAVPTKIFRDLVLLGRAAKAVGKADDAAQYLGRALVVARAAGDRNAIAEVQSLLAEAPASAPASSGR